MRGLRLGLGFTGGASAPFSPASISGMIYWDAADLTTMYQTGNRAAPGTAVSADTDPVGVWLDKGSGQVDMLQATAGKRPLYKTSSGLSWLLLDGTDDYLLTASFALTNGSGEHSSGAAVQFASIAGVRSVIDSDSVGNRCSQNIRLNAGASESIAFNTAVSAFTDTAAAVSATTDKVMTQITQATSVEVFVDGAGNGSTAVTGSAQNASNLLGIGASAQGTAQFLSGRIYRAFHIARKLTASEHASMVTWLAAGQGRTL